MVTQSLDLQSVFLLNRMTRLEIAKVCEILGKEPWSCLSNSAYQLLENPKITVVITLFNYSQYVNECLDSVCASKIEKLEGNFEVLIIDDCSTDNSVSLVEQYLNASQVPICLVKKSFNTGLSDSRNLGIKLARSPYIFMLDADNWIYPNCLMTLYQEIESHDVAAVYGIINRVENQTREGQSLVSCYEWNINELLRGPYIDAMAMFKREIIIQVGGYSTELVYGWEDYDLWLKLAQANYSCKLVPQILSSYRVHSLSMINNTNKHVFSISNYLYKKFASLWQKYKVEELDYFFGTPLNKELGTGVVQLKDEEKEKTILINQMQSELGRLNEEIENLRSQLQATQFQLEKYHTLQPELEQAQAIIKGMKSSKFWQLRRAWFRVKKFLRLPIKEQVIS